MGRDVVLHGKYKRNKLHSTAAYHMVWSNYLLRTCPGHPFDMTRVARHASRCLDQLLLELGVLLLGQGEGLALIAEVHRVAVQVDEDHSLGTGTDRRDQGTIQRHKIDIEHEHVSKEGSKCKSGKGFSMISEKKVCIAQNKSLS